MWQGVRAVAISQSFIKQRVADLCQAGDFPGALQLCEQFCKTHSDDAEGWFLLGAINGALGDFPAAEQCCKRSVSLNPGMSVSHNNLGVALLNQGKYRESEGSFKTAIQLNPAYVEACCDLGSVYKAMHDSRRALEYYRKTIDLEPGYQLAYICMAIILYDQGEQDQAMECYRKLVSLAGSDGARIRLATAAPVCGLTSAGIDAYRETIEQNIAALLDSKLDVRDPIRDIGVANFFIAYQGKNDLELQKKFASLYMHACPTIDYTAPHCMNPNYRSTRKKIRVGFISRYLMDHSIGRTSRGIIEYLSREIFEVYVFFLSRPDDKTGLLIEKSADVSIVLQGTLETAQLEIASHELDILFYQDTGMDITTFFLAFARLAPVQCTSFGHPETTGIPTLDYYISTDMWEPEDGDDHYSEQLVRLRNVPSVAYYYKPETTEQTMQRCDFGLDEKEHVYICPQALFKFHPDFDEILANILRRDKKGRLVLIEGAHANWTRLLKGRFCQSIPDVMDRILFIPQKPAAEFVNLIALSDVMLDTIHFCGFNTTLEGFATGVPIVTLPGKYMRSRHTMSFYNKMGISGCVAKTPAEYVDISVRLACEPNFRTAVSRKIRERRDVLWGDMEVVHEFEQFFIGAMDHAAA